MIVKSRYSSHSACEHIYVPVYSSVTAKSEVTRKLKAIVLLIQLLLILLLLQVTFKGDNSPFCRMNWSESLSELGHTIVMSSPAFVTYPLYCWGSVWFINLVFILALLSGSNDSSQIGLLCRDCGRLMRITVNTAWMSILGRFSSLS